MTEYDYDEEGTAEDEQSTEDITLADAFAVALGILRTEILNNDERYYALTAEYDSTLKRYRNTIDNLRLDLQNKEAARVALVEKVYTLEHTPEIKADTEAAYKRGLEDGKRRADPLGSISKNLFGENVEWAGHETPPQL